MKIPSKEEMIESKEKANAVKERIVSLLETGTEESYKDLCTFMGNQEIINLSAKDRDLYILEIMSNIQRQEMEMNTENSIFMGRNIQELTDLYQRTVFYLRRLEFDFPKELQQEIVPYIMEQRLSMVCILGIIQGSKYIYAKEKTLNSFMTLLENMQ